MTAFWESFQSEIYSMFKQIFLLNAQFTIVCFDAGSSVVAFRG